MCKRPIWTAGWKPDRAAGGSRWMAFGATLNFGRRGGDIEVGSVSGPLRCSSGGGEIRVENAGSTAWLETGGRGDCGSSGRGRRCMPRREAAIFASIAPRAQSSPARREASSRCSRPRAPVTAESFRRRHSSECRQRRAVRVGRRSHPVAECGGRAARFGQFREHLGRTGLQAIRSRIRCSAPTLVT